MRAGSNWRYLNGLSLGMMGDPVRCLPKVVHPDVAALKLQHNHRPVLGNLEEPLLVALRTSEGAAYVPKEFRLEERLGQRATVHRDEWRRPTGRVGMHRSRDQLLPCTRFTGNEHGARCRCHPTNALFELLDSGTFTDDVREVPRMCKGLLECGILLFEAAVLERLADLCLQLIDIERLTEVVVGTQA